MIGGAAMLMATGGTALDPDAAAYIAAVEAADGAALEPDVRSALNVFISGLKADGLWVPIKAACILGAARTLAGALVPLRGPAPTNHGFEGADYSRTTGLKGNASSKYLNSNRNNNADPRDSNHNAVYVTELGTPSVYTLIGTGAAALGTNFLGKGADTRNRFNSGTTGESLGLTYAPGFVGHSRANSSDYVVRSGGSSATVTNPSQTPLSGDLFVYRRNGTPEAYGDFRALFYSIGEDLDLSALGDRLGTLEAALAAALI